MFIKKLQLKNFKRFSDLTIDLSPPNPLDRGGEESKIPKLVLLIGANGSGKSCVFDAFECINSAAKDELKVDAKYAFKSTREYFLKDDSTQKFAIRYQFNDSETIFAQVTAGKIFKVSSFDSSIDEIHNLTGNDLQFQEKGYVGTKDFKFYGRSSFRYTPRITKTTIGATREDISQDSERPKTYIDLDNARMDADIDQIFRDFFKEIKEKNNAQEKFNTALNSAFRNIFGDTETSLKYDDFDSPLDGEPVRFWFKKGASRINYDYLSAGEKMVFDLVLNLYARRNFFQDAVYFFDEIDLHLNTSLQRNLLKEITENWVPKSSQVWVASHSLGFIDYARQSSEAAIIDFDNLDFDVKQELKPENKGLQNYEIAVPKNLIQDLFRGKKIVICENKDDELYNSLLIDEKLFVGVPDKNSVFVETKNNPDYFGLRDRDFLTDEEIKKVKKKYKNLFVLEFYCLENYLYHPDNLSELGLKGFDINDYKQEIERQKNEKKAQIKVQKIKDARKGDSLIKIENIEDSNYAQFIESKLDSKEFKDFYTFFSMKDLFKKECLEQYKLSKMQLSKTKWFRSQMEKIIK
ncbi:MAG: AAA family ATPase [Candidatus Caenarcaniphilales bacterium]|nr:AAA family ATPase [Candidatus Caenarcaniphilales bacterium]